MHMTSRNIILFVLAAVVGVAAGIYYPIIGMVLLVPALIFVTFILLRNRGGKDADPAAAAAARQFTAPPGMAAIYVMRHGFVGGQQGMNVTIDGGLTSQFRTGRFVRAEVAPGPHTVAGRLAAQIGGSDKIHEVTLAPGECVLLDAKLDMGALQSKLVFLETRDPEEARRKLATLKLVEWKATTP